MNTGANILQKAQERVDDFRAKMQGIDLDKVQEKVDDFKAKMEALDLRYSLGRSEAAETFDREWHNFTHFVEEQGNHIRQMGFFSDHTMHTLDKTLLELQTILKEQIPAKESAAQQWRERVMRSVYEMEYIIRELYPHLQEDERDLFSRLRIKMELYRARITGARWEEWGSFSAEMNAVNATIEEALVWRKEQKEAFRKRLETLGQDVSDLFAKVKSKVEGYLN